MPRCFFCMERCPQWKCSHAFETLKTHETQWNAIDKNHDFLLSYNVILMCNLHVNAGILQYYFVLQSLHTVLPSTTLYYKACTKYFPVLLCTTKLAQSTSQYYLLLCTAKLAQSTSSTTLYYKACTKHFPVLHHISRTHSTYNFTFILPENLKA